MFQSLIITLREGIEAALAIGIIMIFLRREGRDHLVRFVYAGLAVAVVASIGGAFVLDDLGLGGENTEGVLMIAAAVLVVTMVVWMARHGRKLKGEIEAKVARATRKDERFAGILLFGLAFLMVFREGIETILLLTAAGFESDALLSLIGGVAGLSIAILFYVAFVRGSVLVDLGRFFRVTGIVLGIFAVQLVLGGIHELGEGGAIPISRAQMQLIGPIVKSDTLFLAALLTLPLIVMLIPATKRAAGPAAGKALSAPEKRRAAGILRTQKRWRAAALVVGIVAVVSLASAYAYSRLPRGIDPPVMLEPVDGDVRVPIAGLNDGRLHRFGVRIDETIVRFFVIEGEKGRLTTAFDACEVCGADGYFEEKGRLICLTCAADIVKTTVGRPGGCNPIPLASRIENGEILVAISDLKTLSGMFKAAEAGPAPPPAR